MSADKILQSAFPKDLVDALLHAYREIESNYAIRRWKASELDAGHFVEAARRIVDYSLTGSCAPIGKSLPSFSDAELKRYEQQASGEESYRLLIPRVLKSIYNVRNKRGVGHLGVVSPNEMDATLILYSVKWVLCEFVRLASGGDVDAAQAAVDEIIERRLNLIWKVGDKARVLHSGLSAREQALVLLYDQNLLAEEELRSFIEYKNATNFRMILRRLHADRLIEFSLGHPLAITPKGVIAAEHLIARLGVGGASGGAARKKITRTRRRK